MGSLKAKRYLEERKTAPTQTEAARRAGYSPKTAAVKASKLEKRIRELGEKGLNTLERVADEGRNEIAVVQAGKTLVETAFGKPTQPQPNQISGNIIINVHKLPAPNDIKHIANELTPNIT